MKVGSSCISCMEGLIEKTVGILGEGKGTAQQFKGFLREIWKDTYSPPVLASEILRIIRKELGIEDPYSRVKERELEEAKVAFDKIKEGFGDDLEAALKLSAIGNSSDHFLDKVSIEKDGNFVMDLEKIERMLIKARNLLILGDNVSDFIFDRNLIDYAKKLSKNVYYCVKGGPAQNDLTIGDVRRFGLYRDFQNFISTGSDNVGLRPSDLRGELKRLWEDETLILAKGMGNYESITEFSNRPIAYVMKVKCEEVSKSIGYPVGTYLAIFREG